MSAISVSLLSPLLVQTLVRPIIAVPVLSLATSRPIACNFPPPGWRRMLLSADFRGCPVPLLSSQYARTNCAGTGLSLSPDTWPRCSISDLSDTPFDLFRIPYLWRIHWPSLFQCLNLALRPNNEIWYGMFSQHVRQLYSDRLSNTMPTNSRVKGFNDTSSPAAFLGINSDSRPELYIPNIPSDLVLLLICATDYTQQGATILFQNEGFVLALSSVVYQ
jgi:hypothetical protein